MTAEIRVRLQAMLAGAIVAASLVVQVVTAQAGLDASSIAAAQSDTPERTWLGWSSGFVPAFVVIGAAYVLVRLIRRHRDNGNAD